MKRILVTTLIILSAVLSTNVAYTSSELISTSLHNGYARIIFNPKEPINYKIETNETLLEILFSKEIKENIPDLSKTLKGYIQNIKKLDDNQTLHIEMSRPFPVRSFLDKEKIFVDILGSPLENLTEKPSTLNKFIAVRTGNHKGFFRYAFDFNEIPKYEITPKDNSTLVLFDEVFNFDKSIISQKLPQQLNRSDLLIENDNKNTKITLAGKMKTNFVHSKSLIIDVYSSSSESKATTTKLPNDDILPKTAPIEKITKAPLEDITKKNNEVSKAPTPPMTATQEPKSEEKLEVLEVSNLSKDAERFRHSRIVSLSFPWNMQTALAAFRRSGYIWLVFDNKKVMDFTMMMRTGGDVIKDMIQIPHSRGTVIRILTHPNYNPNIRREGFLWIVDLVQQPIRSQSRIDIVPIHSSPEGAKLFLPVNNSSPMMSIVDPEVGDVIFAVPVFPLGRGVYPSLSYVDLDFLATAQGVAVIPKNENVTVKSTATGIEFLAPPDGLALSSDADHLIALLGLDDKDKISNNFDLRKWYRGGTETTNYDSFNLNNLMALAPKDKKNLARLETARYYVAHNLPADALGILKNIKQENGNNVDESSFYATRGMANFLMQRYEEAIEDLNHPTLINNEEAIFWRAIAAAAISEPEKQINYLKNAHNFLKTYPQPVRGQLAMIGVKSAIAAEEDSYAQSFLELAFDKDASPYNKAKQAYFNAKWNELSGSYMGALNEYDNVIWYDGSRKYSAYALRDKTKLELDVQRISLDNAIKVFEKLEMAWRGDDFEYEILSTLTDFHLQKKEYKTAFDTLKKARTAFKDTDYEKLILARMQNIFEDLFIQGKADEMSPIKALAIFEDYKELIPAGEQGNELIKKLTDRLVAVDLLDQAGELLDDMITNRSKGIDKSVFGARMALISLLDKKPEKAITALDKSNIENTPPLLEMRRRHLRARALADINKTKDAIDLLKNDESEDGVLLKAEIYWHSQDWDNAADTIKLLIEKPTKEVPVSDVQAKRILDWATALRLAGRDRVIMRLRSNFAPYLKDTPHWDVFNLLTSGREGSISDFNEIYSQVQDVEKFRSFMTDYVSRLRMGEIKTEGKEQPLSDEAIKLQ